MTDVAMLQRQLERERSARKQAETLLEKKSLDLYEAHLALQKACDDLEARVVERTHELSQVNGQLRSEIAERQQTQYALERAKEAAEAASRAKSEFLANMSHELRTPLNAIIGFSDVLGEQVCGPLNELQHQYVGDILESGQHLLSLVNDILDLAKIESGMMDLESSVVDVRALIERTIQMFRERAIRNGIRLKHEIGEDVDCITADERRLKQLLYNFLSNALKFTPENGTVIVRALARRDGFQFSVADTGIGIARDEQDKVFETFYQVDSSLAKSKQGTGLGLALVKNIADLHGGRVWVESELGKGSEFFLLLPPELCTPTAPASDMLARVL